MILSCLTVHAADLSVTESDWAWFGDEDSAYAYSLATTPVGDVDGDGHDEIFVTENTSAASESNYRLFYGTSSGPETAARWELLGVDCPDYSTSVAGGDVNGDGYADLAVGCGYAGGGATPGRVDVYLGGATGLSPVSNWSAEGVDHGMFGWSVAVGDVTGDGYADVAIGAPAYLDPDGGGGSAALYLGSPAGPAGAPAWTYTPGATGESFGASVHVLGDVSGDGYGDLAVGAPRLTNGQAGEGRVYGFYGRTAGLRATASRTWEVNQAEAWLGYTVTGGDFNGDGYGDLASGAGAYDNGSTDEGRSLAWLGSATGLPNTAAWYADGNQEGCYAGTDLRNVGDVDGDGFDDLLVAGAFCEATEVAEGVVSLYRGSATGPEDHAAWSVGGGQASAAFGFMTAPAGDVNGDGYADFLVSAPYYQDGEPYEGRVSLFLGGVMPEVEAPSDTGSIFELTSLAAGDPPPPVAGCSSVPGTGGVLGVCLGLVAARRARRAG